MNLLSKTHDFRKKNIKLNFNFNSDVIFRFEFSSVPNNSSICKQAVRSVASSAASCIEKHWNPREYDEQRFAQRSAAKQFQRKAIIPTK